MIKFVYIHKNGFKCYPEFISYYKIKLWYMKKHVYMLFHQNQWKVREQYNQDIRNQLLQNQYFQSPQNYS
ncbi:hypothetical protein pb186bvf_002780 [Paramecium bursaria]